MSKHATTAFEKNTAPLKKVLERLCGVSSHLRACRSFRVNQERVEDSVRISIFAAEGKSRNVSIAFTFTAAGITALSPQLVSREGVPQIMQISKASYAPYVLCEWLDLCAPFFRADTARHGEAPLRVLGDSEKVLPLSGKKTADDNAYILTGSILRNTDPGKSVLNKTDPYVLHHPPSRAASRYRLSRYEP